MFTDIGFQIAMKFNELPIKTQKIIFVLVFLFIILAVFFYLKKILRLSFKEE